MLSELSLNKISDLINNSNKSDDEKGELNDAMLDIKKALTGQALLINNLATSLRNRQVNESALNNILTENTLSGLLQSIGVPKRNPFSVSEAISASESLSEEMARARDFSNILGTLINVAKIFI
jgi:hypothetical protein